MRIRPVCRFCRQVMPTVDIPEGADHIHHTCPLCGERGPVYPWDDPVWHILRADGTDAWAWTPGRIAVLVIAIVVIVAITLLGAS